MRTFPTKLLALASACALGLVACKGDTGPTGPAGSTGTNGTNGTNGISTGTIAGVLTYNFKSADGTLSTGTTPPATGVHVNVTSVAGLADAVSGADGSYTLSNVPIGTYTVTFKGTGFTDASYAGAVVVAGKTTPVSMVLLGTSPIMLTATPASAPAGFGATATLAVNVSGGTAPYTYSWTAASTNPTAVTLSSATAASPTFTTGTLAAVLASGKVTGLTGLTRLGFVPITTSELGQMTYNFTCKVTDSAGVVNSVKVAVPPATLAQGNGIVPRNEIVVLNVPGNATALTFTSKPGTSAATLNEASGPNPWFIPDVAGDYTVAGLTVTAGDFTTASPTCGGCHGAATKAIVDAKFAAWNNSAHGNYFFQYMQYDAGGNLVWMTDASGAYLKAPTLTAGVTWSNVGRMPLFQFGMEGGAGTHYAQYCMACHTTGYNLLAANNGADDAVAAAAPGWTFPSSTTLKTLFGGDAAPAAPVSTAWDAVPASVKAYAGMQCESCHGPLGQHLAVGGGFAKPVGEYGIGACAVCHSKQPSLWVKSAHSNIALAEEEAVVESRGTNTSCYRCHAAQGFVAYVAQQQAGDPGPIARPAGLLPAPATCTPAPQPGGDYDPACPCKPVAPATTCTGDPAFYAYLSGLGLNRAQVQPQTCAACHDPHATQVRVDGNTGSLANGWQMNGAGAGALCMVCHNTRNGARGDYVTVSSIGAPHAPVQADLYFGQNAYFMGAGGQVSKHAAVEDTCTGCHVFLHPDSLAVSSTNHAFVADGTICKACHGATVGLDALEGQFLVSIGNLEKALATAFTGAVSGGGTVDYNVNVEQLANPQPAAINQAMTVAPSAVGVTTFHGQPYLLLKFAAPVTDPFGTTTSVLASRITGVRLGAGTTAAFGTTGIVAKTAWNYVLTGAANASPAANVIHNPSFVFSVVSNTAGQLLGACTGSPPTCTGL